MKRSGRAASSLVSLLVASACGGQSFEPAAPPTEAGADVSAEQACGDNAHARCSRLATCSPTNMTTAYGDEGTCETRLKLNCLNSLAAADTGNTPALSEGCATAYLALSCDDVLDLHPPTACMEAKGARATGSACGFPAQCASGFCSIIPGSECGTCAPLPEAGDSCAQLTTCGQQLTCYGATLFCTGFAPLGAACNKSEPCGAGLTCVGAGAASNGSCEASVTTRTACDPAAKTGPGCDRNDGLTCGTVTKVCETIKFASAGQPCGTGAEALILCAAAGTCLATADAGAATVTDAGPTSALPQSCVAPASDGARCDLAQGQFCLAPARCIVTTAGGTSGTCQFQTPETCD